MSISYQFYKLTSRKYLHKMLYCSFDGFEDCCKKYWSCLRKDVIRKEFDKKGFETFNSHVVCWKLVDNVNHFVIEPLDESENVSEKETATA